MKGSARDLKLVTAAFCAFAIMASCEKSFSTEEFVTSDTHTLRVGGESGFDAGVSSASAGEAMRSAEQALTSDPGVPTDESVALDPSAVVPTVRQPIANRADQPRCETRNDFEEHNADTVAEVLDAGWRDVERAQPLLTAQSSQFDTDALFAPTSDVMVPDPPTEMIDAIMRANATGDRLAVRALLGTATNEVAE